MSSNPRSLLGLVFLFGCGPPTEPGPPPMVTELPRTLSPAELRIVDGANRFAFALLDQVVRHLPPDSNAFLSPLSASTALAMALNGANGETFDSVATALGFAGMSEADIDQGYRDLIRLLGDLDSDVELRIANSVWVREAFPLEPAFTEASRAFFDAEVRNLDFGSPDAVQTINDWVNGKTSGRIPQLLDRIGAEEVLFLVNAIYFKGNWRQAFDPEDTESGIFHGADGQDHTASLMRQQDTLWYDETDGYQAVDLLYGNGAFAMTALLPKPGRTPTDLLAALTPAAWHELVARFQKTEVQLTFPRFRLEYARRLNDDLEALGMAVAFDPERADFSRLADVRPDRLYLTRVDQKTFVEVNEEGTEAAAATGVGVGVTSAPLMIEMRVDRPFILAIRERLSGTVLFLGVINRPP